MAKRDSARRGAFDIDSEPASLVKMLRTRGSRHVQSSEICRLLSLDRHAAYKQIKTARRLGYTIQYGRGGYALTESTDLPLPWEVADGLAGILGRRVLYFDTIGSTQEYAKSIVDEAEVGTVIIACRQSRGKGRRQRRWHSPRGGIWLSVILPEIDAEMATVLSLGASVALAASIRYVLNKETSLKWPNDILYKGKKLAGIITDADIMSDRLENIVLGVGINVNVNPLEIDAKIAGTENCIGAACIRAPRGATVRLIQDMLRRIQDMLAMIQQKKTGQIISAWNEISSTIGQTVSAGGVKGTALRIDQDGSLVLKLKSGMVRITADDVVHEHATGHTAIHSS